jgi:hypothetical protein
VQRSIECWLLQVVDVHTAGGEELRVFLAENTVTKDTACHEDPL